MHDNPTRMTEWLRLAMATARQCAEAASPGPWQPNAEHDEVVAVDGITVAEGFALSGRQLRATVDHIVVNDPTAALRRIAADQKTLDLHAPVTVEYDDDSPPTLACHTCGSHFEYPTAWPCATLRLLAEGYGWTEEEQK